MGSLLKQNVLLLALLLVPLALSVQSCSDDDTSSNASPGGDYFPFGREYRWTYTTNIRAAKGTPVMQFQMKIDTAISNDRLFWFLMVQDSAHGAIWGRILGLKDENNIIYSLGDHPPEVEYPLFKHSYLANEGVRETITVQGVTYNTIRIDREGDGVKISWWFAPNVGLVKEYSEQGGSLFTDDQWGDDIIMNTELVAFQKIQ